MRRSLPLVTGAALFVAAMVSPVGAQADSISVTPAEGLVDGQTVDVAATTTGSDFATLALCPAAAAPAVGADVVSLLSTRDTCVGLVCLHDGETDVDLAEQIAGDCPLAVQPRPISSVSTAVALPRFANEGTDSAVADCVIVFNTWNSGSAQGAVLTPVAFDESVAAPTAVPTETTIPTETAVPTDTAVPAVPPMTTVELSSPSITSTTAPVTTTVAPPTTVAPQVLGAQETNDGELAVTGLDAGMLAALGLALLVGGTGAHRRARRDPLSRRSR